MVRLDLKWVEGASVKFQPFSQRGEAWLAHDMDTMEQKEILATGGRKGVNFRFRIQVPVQVSPVTHNCKGSFCLLPHLSN